MKKTVWFLLGVLVVGTVFGLRLMKGQVETAEVSTAKTALLGLRVEALTASTRSRLAYVTEADGGVVVMAVHPHGLAQRAGLQRDDLIVAVDGTSVRSIGEYEDALDIALQKETVTLRVKRVDGVQEFRLGPISAASFNNLGAAYVKEKRFDEAIAAFRKAIELEPTLAEAHYNLGNVYAAQERIDEAIEAFEEALKQDPNLRGAIYRLADLHAERGDYDKAMRGYRRLIPFVPSATLERGIKPVEIVEARQGKIARSIETSGTIEANAAVRVFPKLSGVIEELRVEEGDRVEKGEVLAVIEHEALELQLQQAEAAVASAQSSYDQALQLAKVRVDAQVAQARAGVAAAEAALAQVRDLAETRMETQIEQAEAALSAIQANLDKIRKGAREEERQQIRATVDQAKANLDNTESNYARMKQLFEAGAISRQTFEGIETQLEVARAQYEAARQQLLLVEKGAREEDIAAVEAQLRQSAAALRLARTQAEKQTWEQDIRLAEAQLAQAQANLDAALALVEAKSWEADIAAAKAALTQALAARDLARNRLEDATITAPMSGIVALRHQDEGAMAAPTQPLFDLVDMDVVKATVSLIEEDLAAIRVGNPAQVTLQGLPEPVFGTVTAISPTVDPMNRTAKVEITLANPDHRIKPGMFARVQLPTDIRPEAVLLPRDALFRDAATGEHYVFVVEGDKSRRVSVRAGLTSGDLVEVDGGIEPGTRVVYAGPTNLRDGDFIQIVRIVQP